jgi:hypothetical protein
VSRFLAGGAAGLFIYLGLRLLLPSVPTIQSCGAALLITVGVNLVLLAHEIGR